MANDIPEQVFIDAAEAFDQASDVPGNFVGLLSGAPGFRAAVEAAYRAGQAAAGANEVEPLPSFGQLVDRGRMMRAAAQPPPATSWLQTPEVREGDRRRNAAAGPPVTHLWRVGPFWRRSYEVRCGECAWISRAPTRDIGWIRAEGHRLAHMMWARGPSTCWPRDVRDGRS